jgi:N-acetylmuramoyl-L-alanine amidase
MSNIAENKIKYLVIGCSETPAHRDIGVTEIDRMDRQAGKFGCGWHKVIRRDGSIENGRYLWQVGSHTRGYDKSSIGICLVGGGDSGRTGIDSYESEQIESLMEELQYLLEEFPGSIVCGQRYLIGGLSPHFDVRACLGYSGRLSGNTWGR